MLKDIVILILGATGGIGSEIAKRASDEGAKLILVARKEEQLRELSEKLNNSIIFSGDITIYENIKNIIKLAEEKFDRIDVVIHAVGSIVLRPIHGMKIEEFQEILNLNLTSAFLSIKATIRGMIRRKKGAFVFISSVAGRKGLRNHEAISAAKGGLESMIRSAAITYAPKGIRFNAVALGLVDTPLSAQAKLTSNEIALEASQKMHPLGRIGKPKDVVDAILYLASDRSSWVTGAIIPIDGGLAAG